VEVEVAVGGIAVVEGRGVAVKVGASVGVTVRVTGSGVLETVSGMTPVDTHPEITTKIDSRRNEM
jgi:hypothetical protein